jgi:hypothetical protein
VGFTVDVYGFAEAWLHSVASPGAFRAQAHPAGRRLAGDFAASAWSINFQDNTGAWSPVLAVRSANKGEEVDTPEAGGLSTPQLMNVGVANPQVFACAGTRTDDDTGRTTALFELLPPPRRGSAGNVDFIQDVVYGDDHFEPNPPSAPLSGIGPFSPPTPAIHNLPGAAPRDATVLCAMTQFEDDTATRELHMLKVENGTLYHAMASNWSDATASTGSAFKRFNTVSAWADVEPAVGGNFGTVTGAAMFARPRQVHVLLVEKTGNVFKAWHTVRFSSGGGSWRVPDDVLALSHANPQGSALQLRPVIGECPLAGPEAAEALGTNKTEIQYLLYLPDKSAIFNGRIVTTAREWAPGFTSTYSPLSNLAGLLSGSSNDVERNTRIDRMVITTRPFSDNATPPAP